MDGIITYHAFPFNAQMEYMDSTLVKYGLELTHSLDRVLNQKLKTVLSQRDVPGLTGATLPLLKSQGVKALSFGTNEASAPLGFPKDTPFIWKYAETEMMTFLQLRVFHIVK